MLASLGEVLDAPYMIYNRSKSSDMQFAPFTDAAGTVYANSVNGFESNFETHSDTSVRRGAWASFSAGLKAYNQTYAATFATEVNKNVVLARLRNYRQHRGVPAAAAQGSAGGLQQHPATSSRPNWRRTCGATHGCASACWAWTSCCTATSRRRWTRTSTRTCHYEDGCR